MKISVIVPTHNRSAALRATLSLMAKQKFDQPWEVIVVNNLCTDDTDEVVKQQKFPVPVRLVHEDKKPGPAAARNAGAAVATGQYLVFIDNDILVEPDFIERHFNDLENNPGCWFVGQVINLPEQEASVFGQYRKTLSPLVPRDAGLSKAVGLTGQTFSAPRADFEKLGGFDESFFVASGEDRELALRAWEAGMSVLLDPAIVVLHDDWAGSSIQDYCLRQRLYSQTEPLFWRKYGDNYERIQLVRENLPADSTRDSVRLRAWKRAKSVLGSRVGQSTLIRTCELFESVLPWRPILWRLYRLAIAGAIYSGFQQGLEMPGSQERAKTRAGLASRAQP